VTTESTVAAATTATTMVASVVGVVALASVAALVSLMVQLRSGKIYNKLVSLYTENFVYSVKRNSLL
jgi:hypothetical protein